MVAHHCVRLLAAFGVLIIAITSFLVFLKLQGCSFPFSDYLYGTNATSIFLGGMGYSDISIKNYLMIAGILMIAIGVVFRNITHFVR